jgi:hypothetical protein
MGHDVGEEIANLDIEEQVHDGNQVEADTKGLAGLVRTVYESITDQLSVIRS